MICLWNFIVCNSHRKVWAPYLVYDVIN